MERRIERRGGLTTDDDDFPFFPPLLNRTPSVSLQATAAAKVTSCVIEVILPLFSHGDGGAASKNRGCVRALALITQISSIFSGKMGLIWSQYRTMRIESPIIAPSPADPTAH